MLCSPFFTVYFLLSLQLILHTPSISSYFITAQRAFHHCTFSFITAHFVPHCTLKQALLDLWIEFYAENSLYMFALLSHLCRLALNLEITFLPNYVYLSSMSFNGFFDAHGARLVLKEELSRMLTFVRSTIC